MSPECADADDDVHTDDHDPAPPTVDDILDDLRDSGVAVSTRPSYQSSRADTREVSARISTPTATAEIRSDGDVDLGLEAYNTAHYRATDGEVVLTTEARGDDKTYASASTVLEPDAARDLALQLLASAAVADDDREDGLPGYTAE